jgi:hypothetical protein
MCDDKQQRNNDSQCKEEKDYNYNIIINEYSSTGTKVISTTRQEYYYYIR